MHRHPSSDEDVREAAAAWMIRRERGLSATESIEFELWLASDERHAAAFERSSDAWSLLDRVPEEAALPVLRAAHRRRSLRRRFGGAGLIAAAAALVLVTITWNGDPGDAVTATARLSAETPRVVTLHDGTVVRLNTGSAIVEEFSETERRVRLVRGEAHFSITPDATRPFTVRTAGMNVRAVGTAFNVSLQSDSVEVLVTEGVVRLDAAEGSALGGSKFEVVPPLNPGQRAVVALKPVAPEIAIVVTAVSEAEMARALAWQEPLLRLGGARLAEIAASFERRTGQRMILADPALADLRLGGRFRADDLEGFAHLLAATLEIEVERADDGSLILRRKKISDTDSGK